VGSFGGKDGTSAGEATNVVTDYVRLTGEARSHNRPFVRTIVRAYRDAFTAAAAQVTDDRGKKAKVKLTSRLDYFPFHLPEDAPVIRRALAAGKQAGFPPTLRTGNGGLDANWLVKHGIPTVTFGAGQHNIHTQEEYVDVDLFLEGCKMALALATVEA
jgi:tripeptide aminopeptidase